MKKLLVLLSLCLPAYAGYGYQGTITLGGAGQIPATQTNFTILVCANLTLGNGSACQTDTNYKVTGSGGIVTSSSGFDIVFSSTTCNSPTLLTWKMVGYTGSTGAFEAWVKVPSLAAAGTLYVCAGNSAVTTFQGGSAGAAWDSSTVGIWHLPDGSSLSMADDSANGFNGSTSTFTAGTGQVDGGAANGSVSTTNKITLPSSMLSSNVLTMSLWFNAAQVNQYQGLFSIYTSDSDSMEIFIDTSNSRLFGGNFLNQALGATSAISINTWYYVTLTSTGSVTQLYLNGATNGTTGTTNFTTFSAAGSIGNRNTGTFSLNGHIDEVHLAKVARSANWIVTEYHNQTAPTTFMTLGALTAIAAANVQPVLTGAGLVVFPENPSAPANISASGGAISVVAGGTNQNIVLTPSGTGFVQAGAGISATITPASTVTVKGGIVTASSTAGTPSTSCGSITGNNNAWHVAVSAGTVTSCSVTWGGTFSPVTCNITTASTSTTPAITTLNGTGVSVTFAASVGSTTFYGSCF